ncbi:MAG TPA: hypothetical protein VEG38_03655 [Acidimicrobiia bacterium]|nr:hypothetical protein [Acidimicrobiia bacterium]
MRTEGGSGKRTVIVLLLFMGVMGSLWAIGPIVFAGRDDPTAIDTKRVRTAVEAACPQLRADLSALPAGMAAPERAEAENRAVEQFLGRVRAVGPEALADDNPIEQWLADWEQIISARRQAVQSGKRFIPPVVDNAPVNVRMYALIRAGLRECDVPPALLAPEPGRV